VLRIIVAGLLSGVGPLPAIAAPGQGGRDSGTANIGTEDIGTLIVGTVTLTDAAGETFAGEGARVVLACGAENMTGTAVADERGIFRFLNVPVGSCSIEADVQGFAAPAILVVIIPRAPGAPGALGELGAPGETVEADLHLAIAPLSVGVSVARVADSLPPKRPRRSCGPEAVRPGRRLAAACAR
jgi:hypothetical protein